LQESLNREESLFRLAKQEDYQLTLRPLLQQETQIQWLNPQDYPNKEAFQEAYNLAFSKAKAYENILNLLDGSGKRAEAIRKELDKKEVSYAL
jgi:hypothetical protein